MPTGAGSGGAGSASEITGSGFGGPGSGSGSGAGMGGSGEGSGLGNIDRAVCVGGACSSRPSSHSQQSLHLRHLSQRWLLHESFVQRAQMRVDSSPQILHTNDMRAVTSSFLFWEAPG